VPRASLSLFAAILALVSLSACTVRPAGPRGERRRAPPDVVAAYEESGPVPQARLSLRAARSDVETWDVVLPARYAADAPTAARRAIVMRWWRPASAGEPRPAIVLSPILGSDTALVADFALAFSRRGWHALLVERDDIATGGDRAVADVESRIHAAVAHQVQALDWLLTHDDVDPRRVGSFGISAGGIQNAMVAGVDPRYAAHVIALAGGPLADVLVESREHKLEKLTRDGMRREGTDREGFRTRLREAIRTDPVALARYVDPDRVLLVLARNDRSVPSRYGERLREALGEPETVEVPFGHYGSMLSLPLVHAKTMAFLEARFREDRGDARGTAVGANP
jgi:dienelactone hydrolase